MNLLKWSGIGASFLLAMVTAATAQLPGGASGTPQFSGAFAKLFGEHKAFSSDMDMEMVQAGTKDPLTMPTKLAVLDGKSRLEIDLARAKGPQLPVGMAEQLKAMGMSEMTVLSEEGKTNSYMVYPGLKSYAVISTPEAKVTDTSKIKLESTELGKDTVNGQPCIKNKVILTEADGTKSEATVWNATELKKFPVRIETTKDEHKVRMTFNNVKLAKPDAKLFDPPAAYKRYNDVQVMMQEAIMKSIQGGSQK